MLCSLIINKLLNKLNLLFGTLQQRTAEDFNKLFTNWTFMFLEFNVNFLQLLKLSKCMLNFFSLSFSPKFEVGTFTFCKLEVLTNALQSFCLKKFNLPLFKNFWWFYSFNFFSNKKVILIFLKVLKNLTFLCLLYTIFYVVG